MATDRLNNIGVLTRREIEARLVAPLLKAFEAELGRERVVEILRQTIINLAQEQGEQLAQGQGGDSVAHFADSLKYWVKDDALQIEVLTQTEEHFDFNVTRCRYAELYQALGIPRAMFTPVFAVARVAGWTARILEYLATNRIFRPRAVYTGPLQRDLVPIEER